MADIIPLRHIPISTTVDGVELRGEIDALYPNDITVIITSPVGGLSSGIHIPYFAMGHHQMATGRAGRTTGITPHGQQSAEWLLKHLYEYSQGVRKGWPVDAVGPSGWVRLPDE